MPTVDDVINIFDASGPILEQEDRMLRDWVQFQAGQILHGGHELLSVS